MSRSQWVHAEVTLDEKRKLKILARRKSIKTKTFVSVDELVGEYIRVGMERDVAEMESDAHGT